MSIEVSHPEIDHDIATIVEKPSILYNDFDFSRYKYHMFNEQHIPADFLCWGSAHM